MRRKRERERERICEEDEERLYALEPPKAVGESQQTQVEPDSRNRLADHMEMSRPGM